MTNVGDDDDVERKICEKFFNTSHQTCQSISISTYDKIVHL